MSMPARTRWPQRCPSRYRRLCLALACAALAACAALDPNAHLAAFSTQLTGGKVVPPTLSAASGKLDAVLDKNTRLLRWRLSYAGLSGPVTTANFRGPAHSGANAAVTLSVGNALSNPLEGRTTLTAPQAADLLAGKWYVDLRTASHPAGELRGQLILRE